MEFTGANTPQRNGIVERRFLTDGERATAAMVSAKLTPEKRKLLWAEFCYAASKVENISCNSAHDDPPDTLFYGTKSNLPPHLIKLGRIGYIPKDRKVKGKSFFLIQARRLSAVDLQTTMLGTVTGF